MTETPSHRYESEVRQSFASLSPRPIADGALHLSCTWWPMRTLLRRSVVTLLTLVALYLIPVNLALNLPATRAYLNRIAPDRFTLEWTRAWSWYPLRVELRGLAADGQTATEQWQVDAARTSASVSLLPLLRDGLIRVHDLDLVDLELRLRPRPQQAADVQDPLRAFFPVIRHRDPAALAEPAPPPGGALRLEIDDLQVQRPARLLGLSPARHAARRGQRQLHAGHGGRAGRSHRRRPGPAPRIPGHRRRHGRERGRRDQGPHRGPAVRRLRRPKASWP